ncbi:MAG TPA: SURF1 family protein, partial [Longimicrobiales bacterium]|nr:SURF1 family protein [Longimicrobiales bacterium]
MLEITRSGLFATIGVLLVAAVCVRLGIWQLDRREQRLTQNAAVAQRMAESPLSLHGAPRDTTGLTFRLASVTGRYDNERSVVLAGRSRDGAPGVHVLTPLRVGDGAILVNRGWLPSNDAATVDLGAVAVPGPVDAAGMLVPFPDVDVDVERDGFRTTWFRLDADALRSQFPYPVAALYLVESPSDSAPAEGV